MAIKITDWVDGDVLLAADLKDSINSMLTGPAQNANKTLKAAGAYENGDNLAAENYTVAAGINGTVNSFNPTSPYVIIEADSIPTINTNDCTSSTLSTGKFLVFCTIGSDEEKRAKIYKTLFYGTGTGNTGLAKDIVNCTAIKTNISRDVGKRAYYGFSAVTDFANSSSGNYVRLDGSFATTTGNESVSSWSYCTARNDGRGEWEIPTGNVKNFAQSTNSTIVTNDETELDLTADETDNPSTCRFEARAIDSSADYGRVYGFILTSQAITFTETDTVSSIASFSTGSTDFLTDEGIPAFTNVTENIKGTSATFDIDNYALNYILGTEEDGKAVTTRTGLNSGDFTTTVNVTGEGFFSEFFVETGTGGTVTIVIKDAALNTLISIAGNANSVTTVNAEDYTRLIDNEVVTINFTKSTPNMYYLDGQSYSGTDFSYTSQTIPGEDGSNTRYPIKFTPAVRPLTGTISSDTNTFTLDGTEKACLIYSDQTTPANTNVTVDISDGTTTLSAQAITNKSTGVIDMTSLSSGTLKLTFNLSTTDTSVTPVQRGWGALIWR